MFGSQNHTCMYIKLHIVLFVYIHFGQCMILQYMWSKELVSQSILDYVSRAMARIFLVNYPGNGKLCM